MSRRRREKLARLLSLVQERGAVTLAEAALQLGVSYKHMRYFITKELEAMSDCIEVNYDNDTISWVCEDGGDEQ